MHHCPHFDDFFCLYERLMKRLGGLVKTVSTGLLRELSGILWEAKCGG